MAPEGDKRPLDTAQVVLKLRETQIATKRRLLQNDANRSAKSELVTTYVTLLIKHVLPASGCTRVASRGNTPVCCEVRFD